MSEGNNTKYKSNQDVFIKQSDKVNKKKYFSFWGSVFENVMGSFLKILFIVFIIGQFWILFNALISLNELGNNSENMLEFYKNMCYAIGTISILGFGVLLIDILIITFCFILPAIRKN